MIPKLWEGYLERILLVSDLQAETCGWKKLHIRVCHLCHPQLRILHERLVENFGCLKRDPYWHD